MKKLFAGILALALMMGMGTLPAMAESAGLGDKTIDVKAQYNDEITSPKVYSLDITWGAMEFTYNKAGSNVWNPNTHEYEMKTTDSWTAAGNSVTVTNHSNDVVGAFFSYASDPAYSGVTGRFDEDFIELQSAVDTTVANAPSGTAALTLSGSLPEGTTLTRVGTITVGLMNE